MKTIPGVFFAAATGALCFCSSLSAAPVTLASPATGLSVQLDAGSGNYVLSAQTPAWSFRGSLNVPLTHVAVRWGHDTSGSFRQISFAWQAGKLPMQGEIRLYQEKPAVLFAQTCEVAAEAPPAAFPDFTALPPDLHVFSYSQHNFAPPQFRANDNSTPWLLFDDRADALIISPASHFMIAAMQGDGVHEVGSGLNPDLRNLPANFTQSTLVVCGQGINRAWALWGKFMVDQAGITRPANDADDVLKYLGYWTDNGATYYYNYDPTLGYAGTIKALIAHDRQEQIPLRYLQLDSWWYYKSTTDADGRPGNAKKANQLPAGEWNRYGGLLEYRAHTDLFPDGLAAFQRAVNLPLITHNRWIDPASPYHEHYEISGIAAVDPQWWEMIAGYLKASGIVTYEQDWLDHIYRYSPAFATNVDTADRFLDHMARACKAQNITLQYCMPYPCYFMQGCRYDNLTTIRTSDDRFCAARYNDFLYTSRLASALGIWPWADVFMSAETNNVLLATLSGGAVGMGDAIGAENPANIFQAVRRDGVIVKPDAPIVPLDRCYVADANQQPAPLVAATYTDHAGLKTGYVFAFNRHGTRADQLSFTAEELGMRGPVWVHDYFSGVGRRLDPGESFSAPLAEDASAFYQVAPIGKSGIAFLGDAGKFVGTGKQRMASLNDQPHRLTVSLSVAESEKTVTLHGYAATEPQVTVQSGSAGPVQFDPAQHHFTVELTVNESAPLDRSDSDPVRHLTVTFTSLDN
jgi:hypothetical protein